MFSNHLQISVLSLSSLAKKKKKFFNGHLLCDITDGVRFPKVKRSWYISPFIVTAMESSRQTDGSVEKLWDPHCLTSSPKRIAAMPHLKNGLSSTVLGSLARKEILLLSEWSVFQFQDSFVITRIYSRFMFLYWYHKQPTLRNVTVTEGRFRISFTIKASKNIDSSCLVFF